MINVLASFLCSIHFRRCYLFNMLLNICHIVRGCGDGLFSLPGHTLLGLYVNVLLVSFLPHFSHWTSSTTLILPFGLASSFTSSITLTHCSGSSSSIFSIGFSSTLLSSISSSLTTIGCSFFLGALILFRHF